MSQKQQPQQQQETRSNNLFHEFDYDDPPPPPPPPQQQQDEQHQVNENSPMIGGSGSGGGGLPQMNYAEKQRQKRIILLVVVCLVLIVVVVLAFVCALAIPRIIDAVGRRRNREKCHFTAIILGSNGGSTEENLSGLLLSRNTSNAFLAINAGNLLYGLQQFLRQNEMLSRNEMKDNGYVSFDFPTWTKNSALKRAGFLLRNHVWSYLIGHTHWDTLHGLVINSPQDYFTDSKQMFSAGDHDDEKGSKRLKYIMGIESTVRSMSRNVFNDELWPNMVYSDTNYSSDGSESTFSSFSMTGGAQIVDKIDEKFGDEKFDDSDEKHYRYRVLRENESYQVNDLLGFPPPEQMQRHANLYEHWRDVSLKVFPLCNHLVNSTAFLFTSVQFNRTQTDQVLYFSATGPSNKNQNNLVCPWEERVNAIWMDSSLEVDALRAIFIEVSMTNDRSESELNGHLRPIELIRLLRNLKDGRALDSMAHVKVVVQHVIPSFDSMEDVAETIQRQVLDGARRFSIDAEFIFPEQGDYLCL